jgi:Fe-S cluster assembly protein SufB
MRGISPIPSDYAHDAGYGLDEGTVDYISNIKGEAEWIREFRQKALKVFFAKPMPTHWASKDLENIIFKDIRYYLSKGQAPTRSWDEVPDDVKKTFERLGIPEQERASSSLAWKPNSIPRPPTRT